MKKQDEKEYVESSMTTSHIYGQEQMWICSEKISNAQKEEINSILVSSTDLLAEICGIVYEYSRMLELHYGYHDIRKEYDLKEYGEMTREWIHRIISFLQRGRSNQEIFDSALKNFQIQDQMVRIHDPIDKTAFEPIIKLKQVSDCLKFYDRSNDVLSKRFVKRDCPANCGCKAHHVYFRSDKRFNASHDWVDVDSEFHMSRLSFLRRDLEQKLNPEKLLSKILQEKSNELLEQWLQKPTKQNLFFLAIFDLPETKIKAFANALEKIQENFKNESNHPLSSERYESHESNNVKTNVQFEILLKYRNEIKKETKKENKNRNKNQKNQSENLKLKTKISQIRKTIREIETTRQDLINKITSDGHPVGWNSQPMCMIADYYAFIGRINRKLDLIDFFNF